MPAPGDGGSAGKGAAFSRKGTTVVPIRTPGDRRLRRDGSWVGMRSPSTPVKIPTRTPPSATSALVTPWVTMRCATAGTESVGATTSGSVCGRRRLVSRWRARRGWQAACAMTGRSKTTTAASADGARSRCPHVRAEQRRAADPRARDVATADETRPRRSVVTARRVVLVCSSDRRSCSTSAPSRCSTRRHRSPSWPTSSGSVFGALQRYRQIPVRAALDLALPQWVDDPSFDPRRHVVRVVVPPPETRPRFAVSSRRRALSAWVLPTALAPLVARLPQLWPVAHTVCRPTCRAA